MKRLLIVIIFIQVLLSCRIEEKFLPKHTNKNDFKRKISMVEIDTFFPWKSSMAPLNYSIRAIELAQNNLWYAGSNGAYENIALDNKSFTYRRLMKDDTTGYALRSVAKTKDAFFVLTISNPAILVKQDSKGKHIVYEEKHEAVFYDSMDFWNDQEGIAIGDPTQDCISIIITRDGGDTWNKLSCDDLPKAKKGEAAFAASDTNIAIVGDHTWVATGGVASRVLYSPDKGKSWEVYNTPIIQGKETTGIYSMDFYDEFNGFAIGGDYTNPEDNQANKMSTRDGGKTWELVAQGHEPGYRSCVQYIPNSKAKELVAVGFKGIDYSNDYGNSWKHLSDEAFYTIRFLNDTIAYAAGKGRISKLTFK